MKLICPECNKTIKEFELRALNENEVSLFDEEEIATGEALHFMPCRTCRGVSITEI